MPKNKTQEKVDTQAEDHITRIELSLACSEVDLLRILLSRYDDDRLQEFGLTPEACAIRSMEVDSDGRCLFRVIGFAFADVTSLLDRLQEEQGEKIQTQLDQAIQNSEESTKGVQTSAIGDSSRDKAEEPKRRRKQRQNSNRKSNSPSNSEG